MEPDFLQLPLNPVRLSESWRFLAGAKPRRQRRICLDINPLRFFLAYFPYSRRSDS